MKRLYKKKTRQESIEYEKERIKLFFVRRIVYDKASWASSEAQKSAERMKHIA